MSYSLNKNNLLRIFLLSVKQEWKDEKWVFSET